MQKYLNSFQVEEAYTLQLCSCQRQSSERFAHLQNDLYPHPFGDRQTRLGAEQHVVFFFVRLQKLAHLQTAEFFSGRSKNRSFERSTPRTVL